MRPLLSHCPNGMGISDAEVLGRIACSVQRESIWAD